MFSTEGEESMMKKAVILVALVAFVAALPLGALAQAKPAKEAPMVNCCVKSTGDCSKMTKADCKKAKGTEVKDCKTCKATKK
jgi:preprotein translocase subunit SecG